MNTAVARYHDRMRRRVVMILVFLLIGVMINIAVAWGLALRASIRSQGLTLHRQYVFTGTGDVRTARLRDSVSRAVVPADSQLQTIGSKADGASRQLVRESWIGWPVRSFFRSSTWHTNLAVTNGNSSALFEEFSTSRESFWTTLVSGIKNRSSQFLQFRPRWIPFIANSLFYGAVIWGLICAFATIRSAHHRSRGRCIRCMYDLRGVEHARCPECGEDVATAKRRIEFATADG